MNDTVEKLVACDELVKRRIDRTISSCFELVSELMYMKTVTSETTEGRARLRNGLDESFDIVKSIIGGLRELNDLIGE